MRPLLLLLPALFLAAPPALASRTEQEARILSLAFHPSGKRFACVDGDQQVTIRDARSGAEVSEHRPRETIVGGIYRARLAWNSDGSRLLLWRTQMGVEVLDPATDRWLALGDDEALDVSPDPRNPRRVALVRREPEVEFWDPVRGRRTGTKKLQFMKSEWSGRRGRAKLRFRPDRRGDASTRRVAFEPGGKGMAVWAGSQLQYVPLRGRVDQVSSVRNRAFSGGMRVGEHLFRCGTWLSRKALGSRAPGFLDESNEGTTLFVPPPVATVSNRRGIAYAAPGNSRKVTALPSGTRIELEGVQADVTALALDPSGTTLVAGAGDGGVHLYRVVDPAAPKKLAGGGASVHPYDSVASRWIFQVSYEAVPSEGFLLDKSRRRVGLFGGKGHPFTLGSKAFRSTRLEWTLDGGREDLAVASSAPWVRAAFRSASGGKLDVYKGQLRGKVPHGLGILISPDADSAYIGFFRDGKRHGRGALLRRRPRRLATRNGPPRTRRTEELWFGDWEGDRLLRGRFLLDLDSGETSREGVSSYEGEFRDLLPHGVGQGVLGASHLRGTFRAGKLTEGSRTDWAGSLFEVRGGQEAQRTRAAFTLARGDLVRVGTDVKAVYRVHSGIPREVEFADGSRSTARGFPYVAADAAASRRLEERKKKEAREQAARAPEPASYWGGYTPGSTVPTWAPPEPTAAQREDRFRRELKQYDSYLDYKIFGKNTGVKWH